MTSPAIQLDGRTGRGLIAFGATGLVLAIALAVAVVVVLGPVAVGAASLEGKRTSAMSTLDSAAMALDALSGAAHDAGTSLVDSEAAVRDAATVTSQLADAMAGLGVLSSGFAEAAGRSRTLSTDLARAADALQRNETDSQAVGEQLGVLAGQVRDLRTSLGPVTPGGDAMGAIAAALLLVVALLLLGWLALAAGACVWLGRRALITGLDNPRPINRY